MLRLFFIIFFGVIFFSSLFTPAFFSGITYFIEDFRYPFSRVYDRVALLVLIVFLLIYKKDLNLKDLKSYYQGVSSKYIFKVLFVASAITLASVLCIFPNLIDEGIINWKDEYNSKLYFKILMVIPAALLISFLEESIFRLIVFIKIKEKSNFIFAAVVSSLIYATVHFIVPDKGFQYKELELLAGFTYISAVMSNILSPIVLPAFLSLFMVGLILCYVIHRTKNIFLCIGLHTGWVIGVKYAKYMCDFAPGVTYPKVVERNYLLLEPIAWVSIIAVFLFVYLLINNTKIFEIQK